MTTTEKAPPAKTKRSESIRAEAARVEAEEAKAGELAGLDDELRDLHGQQSSVAARIQETEAAIAERKVRETLTELQAVASKFAAARPPGLEDGIRQIAAGITQLAEAITADRNRIQSAAASMRSLGITAPARSGTFPPAGPLAAWGQNAGTAILPPAVRLDRHLVGGLHLPDLVTGAIELACREGLTWTQVTGAAAHPAGVKSEAAEDVLGYLAERG